MKSVFRSIVASILEWQVRRLQQKNSFTTIAVVGSIGKTSTKLAIGKGLAKISKTRYQDGNYNHRITVPLVIFGHNNPANVLNIMRWISIFVSNERQIRSAFPFEYVVLELGTDGPGQIKEFAYLNVDLAVLTAIAPEHMELFKTIDAVAKEEISVKEFSKHLLINADLCDSKFLNDINVDRRTYGKSSGVDIKISSDQTFKLSVGNQTVFQTSDVPLRPKQYSMAALLGVLEFVGQNEPKVITPLLEYELQAQTSGRLQTLTGINNSLVIDDTYNSSPEAVLMALEVLREKPSPQKIAVLGSMNELGESSQSAHQEIGEACNPKDIDLLITIGSEANNYLAPAAVKKGCEVRTFTNPYEAGMYLKSQIKDKAVILAKGSQNGVFAEEAIKLILKNEHDKKKLVRQSEKWLAIKRHQFESKS